MTVIADDRPSLCLASEDDEAGQVSQPGVLPCDSAGVFVVYAVERPSVFRHCVTLVLRDYDETLRL